ncbi:MAG: Hsp20/alpha crystallin family protein [Candidatus Omnitrophica bacterium]|nr:Hsp20/alpha crystallin family protein [Candidatus Omnitrophota bacterium]
MNQLFNFSLDRWDEKPYGILESAWSPAIDVFDSKDNILVKADIPGMKKEDIEVSVHGDTLSIKGEKKEEKEVKEKDFVKTERFYGSFTRSLRLPSEVDSEKVTATYKDGVLELTLAKREETKPKQIKIEIK